MPQKEDAVSFACKAVMNRAFTGPSVRMLMRIRAPLASSDMVASLRRSNNFAVSRSDRSDRVVTA